MAKNDANTNIFEISSIEGLMSQINEHLENIAPKTTEQQLCRLNTRETIANFQKNELFDLRVAFE